MEYIIDPKWVYWINVCGDIKGLAIGVAVCAFVALIVAFVTMGTNAEYGKDDTDYKIGKRIFYISLPVFIVFLIAAVFVPSTKVLLEMMVAKLATKNNIDLTVDSLKSVVDYIAETIKSLR